MVTASGSASALRTWSIVHHSRITGDHLVTCQGRELTMINSLYNIVVI